MLRNYMQTVVDEQNNDKVNTTMDTDDHVIDQDIHSNNHDIDTQDIVANVEITIPSDHD